jgi:cytochrome c oxidase subunit II
VRDVLQSALDPAGPAAAVIGRLWWLMFWVATGVFAIVTGLLAVAVARGRRSRPAEGASSREMEMRTGPLLTRAVTAGTALTVVVLFGLLVASIGAGRAIGSSPSPGGPQAGEALRNAVSINVSGHQFWWEIEYEDASPSRRVTTANEIHVPVGRPVILKVTSRDVIHSFWVPNLQGKRDLVPGYTTALRMQADRPGVYRGQCAEFCGRQHAHMAFEVVADSEAEFGHWLDAQRQPAAEPPNDTASRGREVLLSSRCILCHTIRGTAALGRVGPDLTHLASRATIGASTLPNTRRHLAGWIVNAQQIKPGSQMPPNSLGADDLQSLLAYLESLK